MSFRSLGSDWREMLEEQFEYRDLLLRMTGRDLLLRYKQTVMGLAWAIFMPLTNTAVFSVIFTRVAPMEMEIPYPLFAYCGLLAWNFFASSLKFSAISLTGNSNLVTKVYFPREIFPFSAILVSLVDLAVGAVILAALMAWYHVGLSWSILFLPVVLAVHVVFTAAIALLLAMGNLFYRDVKYLFEVVLMVWMFATSVVYPTSRIGGRLGEILSLNPMTPIIDGYRAVLLLGELPELIPFGIAGAVSLVCLLVSWTAFHRGEFKFAERI